MKEWEKRNYVWKQRECIIEEKKKKKGRIENKKWKSERNEEKKRERN